MPGERILVLEDNPELEQRLVDVLSELGYDPTPLYDRAECVDAASNSGAAVVLLDIDGGSEGVPDLCASLRSRCPGIYTILTGGSDALAGVKEVLGEGADCYLAKPFALPILKRLLAARRARAVPAPAVPTVPVVPTGGASEPEAEPVAPAKPPLPGHAESAPEPPGDEAPTAATVTERVPAADPQPDADLEVVDLALLQEPEAPAGEPLPDDGLPALLLDLSRLHESVRVEVHGAKATTIHLQDGEIVHAEGGGLDTTLGRVLLRRRMIHEDAYREVLSRLSSADGPQDRLGEALMKAGHLTAQQLHDALGAQVEDKVLEAMADDEARFRVLPDGDAAPAAPVYRRPVENLVLKGVMRHGDVDALVGRYKPLKDRTPVLKRGEPLQRARLATRLKGVLDRLDGRATVEELAEADLLPPADFLKLLHGLVLIGAVDLAEARRDVPPATPELPVPGAGAAPEALRERILRAYLELRGLGSLEVLGMAPPAGAEVAAADVEAAYQARLASLDLGALDAVDDAELRGKAREIVAMLDHARGALLDPGVRGRQAAQEAPRAQVRPALTAELHLREGLSWLQRGDAARAIVDLEQACEMAPGEAEYRGALSLALVRRGGADDLVRARDLASRALEANPRIVQALVALAVIFEKAARPAQAERYFGFALKVDPENAEALRGLQALRASQTATASPRLLVLASDLLFAGAARSLPEGQRGLLVTMLRDVFRTSFHRHFDGMLRGAGLTDGTDVLFAESAEWILAAIRYEERLLRDRKALIWRVLSFPDLLRDDAVARFEKHLAGAGLPPGLERAVPRPRLAIAIAEGSLGGGVRGLAPAAALRALALETDRFTIDQPSACELAGAPEPAHAVMAFAEYNYALRVIPETEKGGSPVYVAHYQETPARPGADQAPAVEARPPRVPRSRPRPTRPAERHVSSEELGVLADIRDEVRSRAESDLTTKFNRLKEEEERRRRKSIWQKVIIGEDDSKVDPSRHQIKTRLFAPVLGEGAVFLGMQELRAWFAYMDEIGRTYVDALCTEREGLIGRGGQSLATLAIDPTFHDLELMSEPRLLAVSEALSLFPICIDPDEKYEGIALAELARIAHRRFGDLVGTIPSQWTVIPLVAEVFRKVIDAPDDSVEPVNLFQWAALLALVGVTLELQEAELGELRAAYDEGSRKLRAETDRVKKTFGQYLAILKGGLDQYHRIRRVMTLKAPSSLVTEERGILEKGYQLPLFRFVK